VGDDVGEMVGEPVGAVVGEVVGETLGGLVGSVVDGDWVGVKDGVVVGEEVEGDRVGDILGCDVVHTESPLHVVFARDCNTRAVGWQLTTPLGSHVPQVLLHNGPTNDVGHVVGVAKLAQNVS
jgi:uncharacterized protein YcfJ